MNQMKISIPIRRSGVLTKKQAKFVFFSTTPPRAHVLTRIDVQTKDSSCTVHFVLALASRCGEVVRDFLRSLVRNEFFSLGRPGSPATEPKGHIDRDPVGQTTTPLRSKELRFTSCGGCVEDKSLRFESAG